jgi:hypothetical protein
MEPQTPVKVCDLNPIINLFHLVNTGYNKDTTFLKITPRKKDRGDQPIRAAVVVVEDRHAVGAHGSEATERVETEKEYATGTDYNDAVLNLHEKLKKAARNSIERKRRDLEQEKEKLEAYI